MKYDKRHDNYNLKLLRSIADHNQKNPIQNAISGGEKKEENETLMRNYLCSWFMSNSVASVYIIFCVHIRSFDFVAVTFFFLPLFILHFRCLSSISVVAFVFTKTFHSSAFSFAQWMFRAMYQTYWIRRNRECSSIFRLNAKDCQRNHKPQRIKCMEKIDFFFICWKHTMALCWLLFYFVSFFPTFP